ncbi:D-alanine--D-alanine ligase family protein [Paenibacillus nasutitermitis]|uniref:D-alanine--D-alanine ligase n=1 Tax=Paenibacillus nasutitermitis TaxID=1652958 RepID=A0A917DR77_9BACL|nr:D-alanine--D-alanine ligase family protein [Paenibacillus nasutitermitis]GGD63316.1 D-alanine--D-alanine ligase [Paenibacillus nasutitermitis]
MKTLLYVLYGGKSVEHEISLKSAYTVMQSIDESKFDLYPIYITRSGCWFSRGKLSGKTFLPGDLILEAAEEEPAGTIGRILTELFTLEGPKVVLPILHGSNGEDGTIQGMLELLNVPYVGNGVLASALTLDKALAKEVLASGGLPQAGYRTFPYRNWSEDRDHVISLIEGNIGFPCYVKPGSLGSSIGISRCERREELEIAIEEAYRYDGKIVVEKEVRGREIQVAVMGNEYPLVSLPGEFIQDKTFFDYNAKYIDGRLSMSIPAEIPDILVNRIRQMAEQAYLALNCSGLARVDIFLDAEGALYVNEVNALPGFTAFSMYPVMWERTHGTSYSELIEKLIDYAFNRHADKQRLQYTKE